LVNSLQGFPKYATMRLGLSSSAWFIYFSLKDLYIPCICHPFILLLSFRTERSVVKNLGSTKVDVIEILRFALDDNDNCRLNDTIGHPKGKKTFDKPRHFLNKIVRTFCFLNIL